MVMEGYGANGGWDECWLALDPGVSTGWALLDETLQVLGTGVFQPNDVRDGVDSIVRGCHRSNKRVRVVVERLPKVSGAGALTRQLDEVVREVYETVVETYDLELMIVPPGEWKPSRAAAVAKTYLKTHWHGKKMTQHEKDAVMMGIYAILKDHSS